jgi:hypothetical protein
MTSLVPPYSLNTSTQPTKDKARCSIAEEFEQMLYKTMKEAEQLPALKTAFKAFDR